MATMLGGRKERANQKGEEVSISNGRKVCPSRSMCTGMNPFGQKETIELSALSIRCRIDLASYLFLASIRLTAWGLSVRPSNKLKGPTDYSLATGLKLSARLSLSLYSSAADDRGLADGLHSQIGGKDFGKLRPFILSLCRKLLLGLNTQSHSRLLQRVHPSKC